MCISKVFDMEFSWTQIIIITFSFTMIIIVTVLLWGIYNNNKQPSKNTKNSPKIIDETMINDAHLQRLLMIEIINNKQELSVAIQSETITFDKISNNISLFGKELISSFGLTISQRIVTLMNKRNEVLRTYYQSVKNVICNNGNCVCLEEVESTNDTKIVHQIFPRIDTPDTLDITTITHRKLEGITRDITDNIAASFHIRDVDQTDNKNRPITHLDRLYNLITLYNKELVNQAKSYALRHYDISMNCGQSALEITHYISDELSSLIQDTNFNKDTKNSTHYQNSSK